MTLFSIYIAAEKMHHIIIPVWPYQPDCFS